MYTLETVKENLSKNPKWVERAIVKLFEFQTADEQKSEIAMYHNNKGFNSSDAKRLSYYAKWINSGKHLTGNHLAKAQKVVPKYAKQILQLIQQTAA